MNLMSVLKRAVSFLCGRSQTASSGSRGRLRRMGPEGGYFEFWHEGRMHSVVAGLRYDTDVEQVFLYRDIILTGAECLDVAESSDDLVASLEQSAKEYFKQSDVRLVEHSERNRNVQLRAMEELKALRARKGR
ncbi:MAG: hypothetical protein SF028_06480 [Candidatus Sumerlaeia bacterium]|nr:hypothetical protein [Candidatus Sumerlaeia bacterium]